MVWVIAFGELFFGDLWCVVWGYGGMRTHFSLLNPPLRCLTVASSSALTIDLAKTDKKNPHQPPFVAPYANKSTHFQKIE